MRAGQTEGAARCRTAPQAQTIMCDRALELVANAELDLPDRSGRDGIDRVVAEAVVLVEIPAPGGTGTVTRQRRRLAVTGHHVLREVGEADLLQDAPLIIQQIAEVFSDRIDFQLGATGEEGRQFLRDAEVEGRDVRRLVGVTLGDLAGAVEQTVAVQELVEPGKIEVGGMSRSDRCRG